MNLLESLLEELNYKQQAYMDKMRRSANYYPYTAHENVFMQYQNKNINRIVLPLEKEHIDADPTVRKHLAKNGWFVHNYAGGMAGRYITDMNGEKKLQLKSIGKVLNDTGAGEINHPEMLDRLVKGEDGKPLTGEDGRFKSEKVPQSILHFYNNDKKRAAANHQVNMVVSRDTYDIGGMTSGRSWEHSSCMRLPHSSSDDPRCKEPGVYHSKIKSDLKHHSLVVYAAKKGDDDIEKPLGRIVLKQFKAGNHSIWRTNASSTYGTPPAGFKEAVNKFAEEHWPAKPGKVYKLASGLYDDTGTPRFESPHITGLHKTKESIKFYNNNGKLNDYKDENGVHQPASVWTPKEGDVHIRHFKNDELHNENGPAVKETWPWGASREEHYINGVLHNPNGPAIHAVDKDNFEISHNIDGMLHREGDLPAYHSKTRNSETKTYSIYGLKHREGDKPSHIEKDQYKQLTEYHKFGDLHREGDKPSRTNIMTSMDGNIMSKTVEYHKNGLLHRDGDKPSRTVIHYDKNGNVIRKENSYHKNGLLHRDGDKPAKIIENEGGDITKIYSKHGEEHRDNDKPSSISYNKNTKKISSKRWLVNGERIIGKPFSVSKSNQGVITHIYRKQNDDTHTINKYPDGRTNHTWIHDDGKIVSRLEKDKASISNNTIQINPNLEKDKDGNLHIYDERDWRYMHPVVTRDGKFTYSRNNNGEDNFHRIIPPDDISDYERGRIKEQIKFHLQNGMKDPYVGKHFEKVYNKIKNKL